MHDRVSRRPHRGALPAALLLWATAVHPLAFAPAAGGGPADQGKSAERPSILLIVTDDQGYADLSCYGSTVIDTPRIDQLAQEGRRFTDFHVSAAQCTPSRASMLTGLYPQRIGLEGVLLPRHRHGLDPRETTLPEILKSAGYRTALVGKWHLGHHPPFLPLNHGFDHFYGLPYSNDMKPAAIYRGREVVERDFAQETLTRRLTDEAIAWIESDSGAPFLLCLWHPMPHKPVAASESFRGSSGFGLYGDACRELDYHTGRLLDALERLGLDDDTLVIYTSDNGPWQPRGRPDPDHGGSARPFRGQKATSYEGGLRVPCIVRWPGRTPPATVSDTFWTSMDFLPTFAAAAGVSLPPGLRLDGNNALPLLTGQSEATTYGAFYYYHYNRLDGVRQGRWKYLLPRSNDHDHYFHYRGERADEAMRLFGPPDAVSLAESLFDLRADPSESTNLIATHPQIAERMRALIERARNDLGDERVGRPGRGRREPARLP